jgi:hypothetical protein
MSALPIVFQSMEIVMAVESCVVCGVQFGIPRDFQSKLKESHSNFYCPNGHGQRYTEKTEAEILREKLANEQTNLACERDLRLQAERREAHLRKRIARGVCPCCKRSFQDLRRHMEMKHPGEAKKKATII